MKKNKILSLILSFMMLVSVFPEANAQAEEGGITAGLTNIVTDMGELSPAFSADINYYKIELENLDTIPQISATCEEGYSAQVVQPTKANQYISSITVTNDNDSNDEKTYYVRLVPTEGARIVPVKAVEELSSGTYEGNINEAVDTHPDKMSSGQVTDSLWRSESVAAPYFTVDLGKVMDVTAVRFYSNGGTNAKRMDKLAVSNDGTVFTEVGVFEYKTSYRNDSDGMGGVYAVASFSTPVEARYLKVLNTDTSETYLIISGTRVYARTFDKPELESLEITDGTHTLSPAFSPDVYDYTVEVDDLENLPELTAIAPEGYSAQVTQMTQSDSYSDNYVARIKVTGNGGDFDERVYTVRALSTMHNGILPLTYQESGCAAADGYASFAGGIDLSNLASSYISKSGLNGCYTVDLGNVAKINEIRYNQRINQSQVKSSEVGDNNLASADAFEKIEISTDGISFTDITDKAIKSAKLGNDNLYKLSFYQISFKLSEQLQARYIRVSNDDAKSLWIKGTEVFGKIIYPVFLDSLSTDKGELSPSFDKAIFDYKIMMDNLDDEPTVSAEPETGIDIAELVQPSLDNGYVGKISLRDSTTGRKNTYSVRVIYPDAEEDIAIEGYEDGSSEGFTGDISYGIDGSDENTQWTSGDSLKPQFAAELAQLSNITKVRFYTNEASDAFERIAVSSDGISFTDVTEFARVADLECDAENNKWGKEYYAAQFEFSTPITAKYVRVENNSGNIIKLSGTQISGYTKKVSAPCLKGISLSSGEITPGFNKNTYSYNLLAEDMENLPVISGVRENPDYEALKVISPTAENGYKGKLLISSSRGAAVYVVNVYEDTGIPLEKRAKLKSIALSTEGAAFSPLQGFDADTTVYNYNIPKKNVFPTVKATPEYDGATVLTEQATAEKPFAKITVTSESKENTVEYTINFVFIQKITREALITRKILPYYDMCSQIYKGGSFETAIDGRDGLYWESVDDDIEAMYTFDLGMVTDVTKVIYWNSSGSTVRDAYEDIEISIDGKNFINLSALGIATKKILGWEVHPVWGHRREAIRYSFSTPVEARYIKIGNDDKARIRINGIEVYENIYPAYLETIDSTEGVISPQFDCNVFKYDVTVDSFDTLPFISGTPKGESQIIKTEQPSEANGYIGNITVYDNASGKTNTYTLSVKFPDAELNLNITGYEQGSSIGYKGTLQGGIDGSDTESFFSSSSSLKPRFAVALDKLSNVTEVKYYQDTGEDIASHFERISVSRDGITFVDVTEFATRTEAGWDEGVNWGHNYYVISFKFDAPITARYVRVENNSGDIMNIKGTQIYGYNEKIVPPALKNISLNFGELTPSFSKETYSYDVILDDIEKLPRVIGEPEFLDTEETTVIAPSKENNNKGKILIKSNRGATVYVVKMYEDSGIALDELTELSSISLSFDGTNYSDFEDFDKTVRSYSYPIKNLQTLPLVRAVAAYDEATVEIEQATQENPVARIIVTSASKEVTDVYMISFLYNIALNQPSWCGSGDPTGGVDGNLNTQWKTNTPSYGGGYFAVSLGGHCRIYTMTLYSQLNKTEYFDRVYISKDGSEFELLEGTTLTRVGSVTNDNGVRLYEYEYKFPSAYVDVYAIKIRGQDEYKIKSEINELEIYGEKLFLVSGESRLESLKLDGRAFTDFLPAKQSYTVEIATDAPLPQITEATAADNEASVVISQATQENPVATVTVTAQNAVSKTTYTINFVRAVQPQDNNYLSSLSIEKGKMVPEFTKAVNSYTVYIENSTGLLEKADITAQKEADGATVNISEDGRAVTVTSQSGISNVYNITPVYSSSRLINLTTSGYNITPEFNPEIFDYTVQISNWEDIPELNNVGGAKFLTAQCDTNATMQIKDATADYPLAIITITDETGYLTSTYTIQFVTKQNLADAQAAVLNKLADITVSNSTDLSVLAADIVSVITNSEIQAVYQTALSRTAATSTSDGKISGTLKLSFDGNSAFVKINLVIAKTGGTGGSTDTGGGGGGGGGGASFPSTTFPDSIVDNKVPDENNTESGSITQEAQAQIKGHWAEKEATVLAQKGIVKGKNGSYALEDNVTRAEFIAMLVRVFEIEETMYSGGFTDVSGNEWYAGVISAAHSQGLIEGSDGKAHPNNNITREESVKFLISFVEKYKGQIEVADTTFNDSVKISPWAKQYVGKAVSGGYINGMGNNEFMPKGTLTRAQAMVMIYRVIFNA